MPLMAPVFREINYSRINTLSAAGHSTRTIASVINDQTDNHFKFTASDVKSYLKMGKAASEQMLVSKAAMNSLERTEPDLAPT